MAVFGLLVCALCVGSSHQLTEGFYSYGPSLDSSLPKQNDVASGEIPLKVPVRFYGDLADSIFVNDNGILSFFTDIPQFFGIQFPLHYPVIAPLYSNVDIRGTGNIFYRETQDPQLLDEATEKVQRYYPNLAAPFTAQSIFIATWLEVGYFSSGTDKVNTFQVAVITDGEESFVEFHYGDGGVQWVQGQPQTSGLPDAKAQVGFMSSGKLYTLRGSGTDHVQNLDKWSNTETPGFWMFRVGNIEDTGNVEPPQITYSENGDFHQGNTCRTGSTFCHSKAECVDHEAGFCCKCSHGYFGNGRNCLQDTIPLRVNGRVGIDLNGVKASDIVLQAYVVTTDGRSYTALSKVPASIGRDMQLVNIVGSNIIGWLFARPMGEALNGYQITGGVLNHTADITFSTSNDRAQVRQHFLGLDVFDQLKLETNISGTIPPLRYNNRLKIGTFQQQYVRNSPGRIESKYFLSVTEEETSEEVIVVTVDQTINYKEYCEAEPVSSTPLIMKSARSFVSYEEKENILRFASTNKISSHLENDDPCIAGQVTCVNNSMCISEGETFRCICNRGFETVYGEDGVNEYGCADINECTTGTHRCDPSALCINEVGSFTCECRQGYTGDGYSCFKESQGCDSIACDRGAECKETDQGPQCVCIVGFMWNGDMCIPNAEDDCLVCSAQAWCNRTEAGQISCTCLPGFVGDGKYCDPEVTTEPYYEHETDHKTCMNNKCWCAPGFREHGDLCVRDTSLDNTPTESSTDSQHPEPQCLASSICFCPNGYVLHEDQCLPDPGHHTKGQSGNTLTCNEVSMCSPYGQCVFTSEQLYECQCNPGYEGDGIACQEAASCREQNICHQNAACVYDDDSGKHICVCNDGFLGNGMECASSDNCNVDSDCVEHASCTYSEISEVKECICDVGFVHDYGKCIQQGCSECHPDAECTQDPETESTVCKCNPGFVGDGITQCASVPETCETANICDPNADCVYNSQESAYACQCRTGYEGDGKVCEPIKTCYNTPSMCHHNATCERTQYSFECRCKQGFVGNGLICKEIRPQEGGFLLVSKGIALVKMPFQPNSSNRGIPIQLTYDQIVIGVAVDCVEGRVYWSDIGGKRIKSSFYDGTNSVEFIDTDNSAEGLAVDWVNRKLYWTDPGSETINEANLDTGEQKAIVSSGLKNPRGIAVHPGKRKVFWSDWNRDSPKLEWSWLDGSGRTVLIQDKTVMLPNSLAIDFDHNELCWSDAGTQKIECMGIDNQQRRTVVTNCTYPFGLAITGDKYYWTDWNTQKIESAWKYTGTSAGSLVVPGGAGRLYGIAAVNNNCPRQ